MRIKPTSSARWVMPSLALLVAAALTACTGGSSPQAGSSASVTSSSAGTS
jgi:hypothetical protein